MSAGPAPPPRIESLDALRGLGVLGILAVNVSFMGATFTQAVEPAAWPFPNTGASLAAWCLVHVFAESKFITLFSLLFGVSMFLVGGEPGDAGRDARLARRLGWLAVFGLVHGALVWYGDVLLDYAACGFALMRLRGWPARRLVAAGIVGYAAGVALMTIGPTVPGFLGWVLPAAPPTAAAFQGTFAESLRANAATWVDYRALVAFYTWPYSAPLMLLGLGLFKSGVLTGAAEPRLYRAGVAAGAVALAVFALGTARHVQLGLASDYGATWGELLLQLTSPFVSLGYASALLLAMRSRAFAWVAHGLAPLGRMAFTNYIAQSLLVTAVFYGGRGLGLFDRVDRPGLALVVLAVWAIELAWSHTWLRRYEAGPLEWGWRCLTFARHVPNRRAPRAKP